MRDGLWVAMALLLAGCASTPVREKPQLPVPNAWPTQSQSDDSRARVPAATHWREFFRDPQLHGLIEAALEHNRDLRIAAGRVQEARAQLALSRADRLPTLNLLATGAFAGVPADLSASGAATSSQRLDLSVSSVSFEADFWGRVANLGEAARLSLLASEEAKRAVQLSLIADVANGYFSYLQSLDAERVAQAILASREQTLALIDKGRQIGGANDAEYQLAAGLVQAARSNLEGAKNITRQTVNRINFLVGNAGPALPAVGRMDVQGLDVSIAAGLPSDVLLTRPDVVAAEQRLYASQANVGAARAAFLPKIVLTAGLGLASQGLAALFSGGAWNFQPTLALPLFDGGRLAAGVDLAQARQVIAVADYEKTIQLAFREVSDLLYLRETLERQLQAADLNGRAQARLLQIAQARHQGGVASYLEVLEAERSYMIALQTISQIRRIQLENATQLYKALGGGGEA